MTEDENNMRDQNNMRHTQWFAVTAFSIIALVAMTSNFEDDIGDEKSDVKWAVSAVSLSLIFSTLAVFGHFLLKDKFVGKTAEKGLTILTFGFWAAVLPAIMDPDNNLAVLSRSGGLLNENLYFFSWGSFIMSFLILFGIMKLEIPSGESEGNTEMWAWAGLFLTSFVVMIASSRQFDDVQCDKDLPDFADEFEAYCDRIKYGISLGVISTILSLVWIFAQRCFKGRMGNLIDTFLVWLLLIFWICGVTYLTFDNEKAPASNLGNLYFFTWLSFGLLVFMAMTTVQKLFGGKGEETELPQQKEEGKEEGNEEGIEEGKEEGTGEKPSEDVVEEDKIEKLDEVPLAVETEA